MNVPLKTIPRLAMAFCGVLLSMACDQAGKEEVTVDFLPSHLRGAFIAVDLLPSSAQEKLTEERFTIPKYDDWKVFDTFPVRAKGSSAQGMFSEKGMAVAFENVCAMTMPTHVRPILGGLSVSHYMEALGKMDLWVECHYQALPSDVEKIRRDIEQAWRGRYAITDEEGGWRLSTQPLPGVSKIDDLGFVWSKDSFVMETVRESSSTHESISVTMDPLSGLIRVRQSEGARN